MEPLRFCDNVRLRSGCIFDLLFEHLIHADLAMRCRKELELRLMLVDWLCAWRWIAMSSKNRRLSFQFLLLFLRDRFPSLRVAAVQAYHATRS
jgi:hypothetical protein